LGTTVRGEVRNIWSGKDYGLCHIKKKATTNGTYLYMLQLTDKWEVNVFLDVMKTQYVVVI